MHNHTAWLCVPHTALPRHRHSLFSSQVLRIGLMGCNSTRDNVHRVLRALQDALKRCHRSRL